jgi:hypothetical protein
MTADKVWTCRQILLKLITAKCGDSECWQTAMLKVVSDGNTFGNQSAEREFFRCA